MTFQFNRAAGIRGFSGRTLYNANARFDGSAKALTEDDMRRLAPSIFATEAHESRSDRFRPIPTIEVLRGVIKEGFVPVAVKQCSARDASKYNFTKHLIRLRREGDLAAFRVGDTVCEVILQNGNDGSSAYNLMAGLFRIACLNSLVCQTETIDTVKVRHSGDVQSKVIEGTFQVLSEAQKALAAPADWSKINLSLDDRMAYAEAARVLRFGDADGEVAGGVPAERLLQARRPEDAANDLWTTFNRVQENAIVGGITGTRIQNGRRRRFTTRAINGIDQDVKLNKALWVLSEALAKHKRAA